MWRDLACCASCWRNALVRCQSREQAPRIALAAEAHLFAPRQFAHQLVDVEPHDRALTVWTSPEFVDTELSSILER